MPLQNQFQQMPIVGLVDPEARSSTISVQVAASELGTLSYGEPVVVVDVIGITPQVRAATSSADDIFGFVNYGPKLSGFQAGDRLEVSFHRGNIMWMEALDELDAWEDVSCAITEIKVKPAESGERIIGKSLAQASAAGDLIPVVIDLPGKLSGGVVPIPQISRINTVAKVEPVNADWSFLMPDANFLQQGDMIVYYVSAYSQNPLGHEILWFGIDSDTTPPDWEGFATAYNTFMVAILSTDTASEISAKIQDQTGGSLLNVSANDFGGGLIDSFYYEVGAVQDPVALHSDGSSLAEITVTQVVKGTDSNYGLSDYFLVWAADNTKYYGWLNLFADSNADPHPSGATQIHSFSDGRSILGILFVDDSDPDPDNWIHYPTTADGIATRIADAINLTAPTKFSAVASTNHVVVTCLQNGATTEIAIGTMPSGFTVETLQVGAP